MKQLKQIKIQKRFWDMIVSGEKTKEFRKITKGLDEDDYEFVSIDEKEFCSSCNKFGCLDPAENHQEYINEKREIYGTAHLNPIGLVNNVRQFENDGEVSSYATISGMYIEIHEKEYQFMADNYFAKNLTVIAYNITKVREA